MIEKIREQAKSINWTDSSAVQGFYESNRLYFDNYSLLTEQNEIEDVVNMKSHHLASLLEKGNYTDGLLIADHIDFLLKRIEGKSNNYIHLNERNNFHKGALLGHSKKYKESYVIFQKLREINPDNNLYKHWVADLRLNILTSKIQIISYVGLAVVIADILSGLLFDYDFDRRIVILGFVLAIIPWLIPPALKQIRKSRTAHNTQ